MLFTVFGRFDAVSVSDSVGTCLLTFSILDEPMEDFNLKLIGFA